MDWLVAARGLEAGGGAHLVMARGSAAARTRNLHTSSWPFNAALCRGVAWLKKIAVRLAACILNTLTKAAHKWSSASTAAAARTRISHTLIWPSEAAQ